MHENFQSSFFFGNFFLGTGLIVLYVAITVFRHIFEPKIIGNEITVGKRSLVYPEGMTANVETIKTEDKTLIKNWNCDTFYRITISRSIKNDAVEFIIR